MVEFNKALARFEIIKYVIQVQIGTNTTVTIFFKLQVPLNELQPN